MKTEERDCENCKHYKPLEDSSGRKLEIRACEKWNCCFESKKPSKNQ